MITTLSFIGEVWYAVALLVLAIIFGPTILKWLIASPFLAVAGLLWLINKFWYVFILVGGIGFSLVCLSEMKRENEMMAKGYRWHKVDLYGNLSRYGEVVWYDPKTGL